MTGYKMRTALSAAALVMMSMPAPAQIQTAEIERACGKRTQVVAIVGDDPEVVGERVDAFCRGYLEASFDALQASSRVCISDARPSSEYLASVFLTYLKSVPGAREQPATRAVFASFLRAFPCTTPTPPTGTSSTAPDRPSPR